MCGICGIVAADGLLQEEQAALNEMLRVLVHRGPDDEGTLVKRHVALGVRRLAIVDVAGGHQPMANETGDIWIAYNGEAYNHEELRQELEKKGHVFRTSCDTEVVLHLYEEMGDRCVEELNGMFSFAIWDGPRRRLLLARDRLGIKPLYYAELKGRLLFGSELKALLKFPGLERRTDFPSLFKYFLYEYVPAPHTIFQGIRKLKSGHILTWENGEVRTTRYWNVRIGCDPGCPYPDEREASGKVRELLRQSVNRRLMSDVPLGVLLSGGVDSSSIAALMAELTPGNVDAFTIGFDEKSFDETRYARIVAKHLGIRLHEEKVGSRELLEMVPKIVEMLDEPLGDSSIVPTYALCRFARRFVKVALGGDGGDELFAGYPHYPAHRMSAVYERLPWLLRGKIIPWFIQKMPVSTGYFSLDFQAKRFASGIGQEYWARNAIWLGSFAPHEIPQLVQTDLARSFDTEELFRPVTDLVRACASRDFLDKILNLDMNMYMQDDILAKVDRASMANSLEARVPFLDHKLVEYVASLPTGLKLRHWRGTKHILRQAVKHDLPREVVGRWKHGFNIPAAEWIKKELKQEILDTLSGDRLRQDGYLNERIVGRLLEEHFRGKKDNRKQIWTLYVFQRWLDRYM